MFSAICVMICDDYIICHHFRGDAFIRTFLMVVSNKIFPIYLSEIPKSIFIFIETSKLIFTDL